MWFKRRKDILSEIKCNQRVAGRLTFDLLTQRSIFGFHFPFSFEYEVGSLLIAKMQRYCTGKHAPCLSHSDLNLNKLHVSVWRYSFYGNVPIPICWLNYGIIGTCLKPHSYGENLLTCANLHMSRFAHVSKSKFAMRSDENYVPWANTWNIIWN